MEKYELGLRKKSFELNFNNGTIWCEHLDSMCDKRTLLLEKFNSDLKVIGRPSTSSFIVIAVEETDVDKELLNYILFSLSNLDKPLRKVVFVGLNKELSKYIKKMNKKVLFALNSTDDFEKAKEWLI